MWSLPLELLGLIDVPQVEERAQLREQQALHAAIKVVPVDDVGDAALVEHAPRPLELLVRVERERELNLASNKGPDPWRTSCKEKRGGFW